jgi:hypothetical protein
MTMPKTARVFLAVMAMIVAAAVAAGLLSAGAPAGASTAVCGPACTSPLVESLGTGEVLTAEGSSYGSGVKMAAASTGDTEQDWTIMSENGVPNAAAAGVVSPKLTMMYNLSDLIEIEYVPGGTPSGLCLANTANDPEDPNGYDYYETPTTSVALQWCGVTAQSLWIIDQNCALDTYCDLINAGYENQYTYGAPADQGTNTPGDGVDDSTADGDMLTAPFAEPMVLTASSSGALSLAMLSELGNVVPPADQAWAGYTAPDQSALRAALRKAGLKALKASYSF